MQLSELIQFLLYLFILSNAAFLGLLFLTARSKNRRANIYLGLSLWCIALSISNHILSHPRIENIFGASIIVIDPFLLILPFLFFYLLASINKVTKKWHYLIFIPGAIQAVLLHFNSNFMQEIGIAIFEYVVYFFEVALTFYALRILKKHKKDITEYYSDIEHKSMSWLKQLLTLNIFLHSLIILSEVLGMINVEFAYSGDVLMILFFANLIFIIYWIGYNGLTQPEIFSERLFLVTKTDKKPELMDLKKSSQLEKIKDPKPVCSDEDIEKFHEIKSQIQKQELYSNQELNLRSLAVALELKEKELSRLINECGNVNFYQFINEYRIDKYKRLLQSPKAQHLSILGLATEAGFSSKSTFYSAFKTLEGMTPKQYEVSIKKSE